MQTLAEVKAIIADQGEKGARAILAKQIGSTEKAGEYLIVPGRYQADYANATDSLAAQWIILCLHKGCLHVRYEGTHLMKCVGGARPIDEGSMRTDAGSAHQGDDGTWMWDTD
ncbi:MAG: hypothetical protein RL094_563 [Candidatus Parcubacteria bacterium]|jgi:hypothetical protein